MENFLNFIPIEFRKFAVLGYFDGDGSIWIGKRKQYVSIRGTNEVLLGIVNTLNITKYCLRQYDSIPSLTIGTKSEIRKFYELYTDCEIFLLRKKAKFDIVFHQDQTISSPQ